MHQIQNNFNIQDTPPILAAEENKISSEAIKAIRGLSIVFLLAGGACMLAGLYVPAIALFVASAAALVFGFTAVNQEATPPAALASDNIYRPSVEDEEVWEEERYLSQLPRVVERIKRIIRTPGIRKLGVLLELKIVTPYALSNIKNKHLIGVSLILRYSLLDFNREPTREVRSNSELYRIIFSSLSPDQKQKIRELIEDASTENSKLSHMMGQDIPIFAAREYGIEKIPHRISPDEILAMEHLQYLSPHMIEFFRPPIHEPFVSRELL